ncbi:MAG: hypothetical protein K940chlam3_01102 [Chlamydiae bacterium]|nr:hypothetical protein [Chlamydiota bacterium]
MDPFIDRDSSQINPIFEAVEAEISSEKGVEGLEDKIDLYFENYSPAGRDKEQLSDSLHTGFMYLQKLTDPDLVKQDTNLSAFVRQNNLEQRKKLVADIITAADFLAKSKAGLLDQGAQNEVLGSSSFLFKDPGGIIGQLLDECEPYERESTHFGAYPDGGVKKGVDFDSGLLPTVKQNGAIKEPRRHIHYYAFKEANGDDYIGLKLEHSGWHGLTGFFKKEKIGHNVGHMKEFVKTRPIMKKLIAKTTKLLEDYNMKKNPEQRIFTRRDTDKKYRNVTKKLLKAHGVSVKKPGKIKKQRMKVTRKLKAKPSSPSEIKITFKNPNIEKKHKVEIDAFKQLIKDVEKRGNIEDIENLWGKMADLEKREILPVHQSDESLVTMAEYQKLSSEIRKKKQIEQFDEASRMGDEIVFDLSNQEIKYQNILNEIRIYRRKIK